MRKRDDPEVYSLPLCASDCRKLWEKYCRGCNLVFCADHVEREKHGCANRDQRPPAAAKPEKRVKKPKKPPATSPPPENGPDLFVPSPSNGVASVPGSH
jgi:hypothetical protein